MHTHIYTYIFFTSYSFFLSPFFIYYFFIVLFIFFPFFPSFFLFLGCLELNFKKNICDIKLYEKTFFPLHFEFCRLLYHSLFLPYLNPSLSVSSSSASSISTSISSSSSSTSPSTFIFPLSPISLTSSTEQNNYKRQKNMKNTVIDPKLSFQALQMLVDPNSVRVEYER